MKPRLLFASTEVPSFGGSATAAYELFRRLLDDGHDVHLVNILDEQDRSFFTYTFGARFGNPLGLPGVSIAWIQGGASTKQPALAEQLRPIQADVLVGFGHTATRLLKSALPDARLAFVTGSCRQAAEYVASGQARDAVDLVQRLSASDARLPYLHHHERIAVERADLVITHSAQTLWMMGRFFPSAICNIYPEPIWFTEWIRDGALAGQDRARPFAERDIDVLFVATDWGRPVKNYALLESIARALSPVVVHVVGDVPRSTAGVVHHGFVHSRDELFDLVGRARVVVSPSLIDASPGVLVEASVLGANIVASRNCGNWEICHPDLLVDPFGLPGFLSCIRRALERKYDDNLDLLLERPGYADFVAVLSAFAQPFETVAIP